MNSYKVRREYWDFDPSWADLVCELWTGAGRVQQIKDDARIEPFRLRAKKAFKDQGIEFSSVKTYINCQVPKIETGYDDGYPHIHYPLDATTLVHYLDPGDDPAPLHILIDGRVVEVIFPERGLTVFMPNDLWHGVLKNNGTTNRLAMIATALR